MSSSMAVPLRVDVAVIGGGLTGVAAAYFLAHAGVATALVERGRVGGADAGASARSAGLVPTGPADHPNRVAHGVGAAGAAAIWRFSAENGRIVRELRERHAIECGYAVTGSRAGAANDAEARDLEASAALLREHAPELGVEYERGRAGAGARPASLLYPHDACLDVAAFLRGLLAAAAGKGLRVLEEAPATALEVSGSGAGLETARGEVRAEIAIVAANAWAPEIHPFFRGLVWPVRGQGLVTAPLSPVLDRPLTASWGHELYRQRPDGRLVAAGFRPDPGEDEIGYDARPDAEFQGFLERFAARRIAALPAQLPVEERFAGICAFSSDGLPLVGALPGQPKILAACGFTMRGLAFGAAAGRAVARLAVDGVREAPQSFSPLRFL